MATDLTRIGEKARKEPGLVFTSLYHHICDVDNLRACYGTCLVCELPAPILAVGIGHGHNRELIIDDHLEGLGQTLGEGRLKLREVVEKTPFLLGTGFI